MTEADPAGPPEGLFQVRIHGRGGQGVVTAAELLSVAAFDEGRYAQAFPSFGSERTGAPVVSYCRIDVKPIRSREPVVEPDLVIVQDVTLLHHVDLFGGLGEDGYVLVNTSKGLDELGLAELTEHLRPGRVVTCPATELALAHVRRPVPNAPLLGAFAALTGLVSLEAIRRALGERFAGEVGERNAAAAAEAFAVVAAQREDHRAASA